MSSHSSERVLNQNESPSHVLTLFGGSHPLSPSPFRRGGTMDGLPTLDRRSAGRSPSEVVTACSLLPSGGGHEFPLSRRERLNEKVQPPKFEVTRQGDFKKENG